MFFELGKKLKSCCCDLEKKDGRHAERTPAFNILD